MNSLNVPYFLIINNIGASQGDELCCTYFLSICSCNWIFNSFNYADVIQYVVLNLDITTGVISMVNSTYLCGEKN